MVTRRMIAFFIFFLFALLSASLALAEELPTPDMTKCPYEIGSAVPSQPTEKLKKRYQSYYCLIRDLENVLAEEENEKTKQLIQAQIDSHNKQLRWIIEKIRYRHQ